MIIIIIMIQIMTTIIVLIQLIMIIVMIIIMMMIIMIMGGRGVAAGLRRCNLSPIHPFLSSAALCATRVFFATFPSQVSEGAALHQATKQNNKKTRNKQ